MEKEKLPGFSIILIIFFVACIFIDLLKMHDDIKTLKSMLAQQVNVAYQARQDIAACEKTARLLATDIDILERVVIRGEYIDIAEEDIHD